MAEAHSSTTGTTTPARAYLDVSRMPDGRYCVVYTGGGVSRTSYTPSLEQVVRQAQRAGRLPVRTDDSELRQRCQECELPLL